MRRIMSIFALAAMLAAPVALSAAQKDVKLPPFTERTLSNGLKVFVVETREVPMVTVRFHLPAGSSLDPRGKEGLAELTATMLMRGAGGIGAEEMAVMIESVGGSLETGTGPDETHIAGDFMARDLSLALDLLAKVVTAPDFPRGGIRKREGDRRLRPDRRQGGSLRDRYEGFHQGAARRPSVRRPGEGVHRFGGKDNARRRRRLSQG